MLCWIEMQVDAQPGLQAELAVAVVAVLVSIVHSQAGAVVRNALEEVDSALAVHGDHMELELADFVVELDVQTEEACCMETAVFVLVLAVRMRAQEWVAYHMAKLVVEQELEPHQSGIWALGHILVESRSGRSDLGARQKRLLERDSPAEHYKLLQACFAASSGNMPFCLDCVE